MLFRSVGEDDIEEGFELGADGEGDAANSAEPGPNPRPTLVTPRRRPSEGQLWAAARYSTPRSYRRPLLIALTGSVGAIRKSRLYFRSALYMGWKFAKLGL